MSTIRKEQIFKVMKFLTLESAKFYSSKINGFTVIGSLPKYKKYTFQFSIVKTDATRWHHIMVLIKYNVHGCLQMALHVMSLHNFLPSTIRILKRFNIIFVSVL